MHFLVFSTTQYCQYYQRSILNTAAYYNITARIGSVRTGPVRLGPAQPGPTQNTQTWPARPVRRAPNPGWGDGGGGGGSFFGDAARARSAPDARRGCPVRWGERRREGAAGGVRTRTKWRQPPPPPIPTPTLAANMELSLGPRAADQRARETLRGACGGKLRPLSPLPLPAARSRTISYR